MEKIKISVPAQKKYLSVIRKTGALFLKASGVPNKKHYHILLSCEEILTNIIKYSGCDSMIDLTAEINGGIKITIAYAGNFYDYSKYKKKKDLKKPGGLGLFIVNKVMDDVKTVQTKTKVKVILKKNLNINKAAEKEAGV